MLIATITKAEIFHEINSSRPCSLKSIGQRMKLGRNNIAGVYVIGITVTCSYLIDAHKL